jgi:tripartite-type tricarboxylate transporter receptor subunit TctC
MCAFTRVFNAPLRLIALCLALAVASNAPARADEVADFYQGKVVSLIVSASAGGNYDTLARTVARFLGRHVPGRPAVIVRNMAGAGGIAAANHLANVAEKDGTQIGLLQNSTAFDPIYGARDVRFEPTRFAWLGSPGIETGLFAVWNMVPVNSLADVRRRETTVGAAGANSTGAFHARLLSDVFGLKLKIVNGFPGQTEAFMAMERGELEGYASVLYTALQVTRSDWLPTGKIKALLSYGPERRRELADVPYAAEIAEGDDNRLLLEAAFAPLALGRPFVMPPGVPPERLAAMRKALLGTFADPAFLAEGERLALGINAAREGETLLDLIRRVYAMPPRVLERLRKLNTPAR